MASPEIDLTGNDTLKTQWSVDPLTGNLTIKFKKPGSPDVELGSIVLEGNKIRSMMDSLEEVVRKYYPDLVPRVKQRTNHDHQQGLTTTVFDT